MSSTVRSAQADDAGALSGLAERTFREAFAATNRPEDMDQYCASAFAPDVQAREIANPAIATWVVEDEGSLVAYAQLHLRSHHPSCVTRLPAAELRRIYVDKNAQGTGVARELLTRACDRARQAGARTLWLGVWEHNPRAIRFYRKHGFSTVGDLTFTLGSDPQRDLVMARPCQGVDL